MKGFSQNLRGVAISLSSSSRPPHFAEAGAAAASVGATSPATALWLVAVVRGRLLKII